MSEYLVNMDIEKKNQILRLLVVGFLIIFFQPTSAMATALGDLAAQMQPGTWAELKTNNFDGVLNFPGGNPAANILEYADSAAWDPISQQFLFIGGSHYESTKFVTYSALTNSWTVMPQPPWCGCGIQWHSYDYNAINPVKGEFYVAFQKYNIASKTWSAVPSIPGVTFGRAHLAVEYFPEMNGLIIIGDGAVYHYNESTNKWATLASGLGFSGLHPVAEYNRVHKVVYFGGGDGSNQMFKLDNSGKVTTLKPAPLDIGIWHTIVTVDPVSGEYLIFGNGKLFYSYNIVTDTWKQKDGSSIPIFNPARDPETFSIVATPVSTYGVVMFVKDYYGQSTVYLYKHSSGGTGDTSPPASPSNLKIQ